MTVCMLSFLNSIMVDNDAAFFSVRRLVPELSWLGPEHFWHCIFELFAPCVCFHILIKFW